LFRLCLRQRSFKAPGYRVMHSSAPAKAVDLMGHGGPGVGPAALVFTTAAVACKHDATP